VGKRGRVKGGEMGKRGREKGRGLRVGTWEKRGRLRLGEKGRVKDGKKGNVMGGKKGMDKGGEKGAGIWLWRKQVWLYVGKKGGGLMVGKRREGYGWLTIPFFQPITSPFFPSLTLSLFHP
jgi:hypothetical protein